MACRSYGPNEGRIDRAHGAAAVTKERQGPPTLAAEPLRASLARSDRNIVRTERRYPFHAPEPACRGVSAVSVKSVVTLENTGTSYAVFCLKKKKAYFESRFGDENRT